MLKNWRTVAITMDPCGQRFKYFLDKNRHLEIETFNAIDGRTLDFNELVKNGLISEELSRSSLLTKGTAGCAESHRSLWQKSVEENLCYLILEDDCYTHSDLNTFIAEHLDTLLKIDICLLGVNTDVDFHSISPQGLMSITNFMPKHPKEEWILNALSRTNPRGVKFHKLLRAAGTCAYFINPIGARKMIAKTFPLSLEIKEPYKRIPPFSLDRSASKVYRSISAAVCQPFMAYTPNIDSTTIK